MGTSASYADWGAASHSHDEYFWSDLTHPRQQSVAATPSGHGYWLVASDAGSFSSVDAGFYGSHGASPIKTAVAGMTATSNGNGYWLVATDGAMLGCGTSEFFDRPGSLQSS